MNYRETAKKVKEASIILGALPEADRNRALQAIGRALTEHKEEIFAANRQDLEKGADLPAPILGRLKFDDHKLQDVVAGIEGLVGLEDPVARVLFERELDEGLVLSRVTCPIGVIGVIFESRPDALVQISSLCIKSGNGSILKGGSEALRTNKALFDVIYQAGIEAGLPEYFTALIEDRAGISEIIKCSESIDLLIPRGSNAFVKFIMDNSDIPVMGHADGICHVYVDKDADLDKAIPLIIDAIAHINHYGSHHTDSIVTENAAAADLFQNLVDSAGVYWNASTRFADGFRYGFGAEVGISTGKMPPRGPVGLDGLVTYKYKLKGNGHIVGDYASGKRSFHFREL